MPKNVGFRVLGMYFGAKDSVTEEVRVDVLKANPTVYDVMVEVIKKVESGTSSQSGVKGVEAFTFDPIAPLPTDSLNSITIKYSDDPKLGAPYKKGVYFLQEIKMYNPVFVFQYYIFDKAGKQKNNNNKTRNFNQTPDAGAEIVDDDVIVWRQVAIMQGPNGLNRVEAELEKSMQSLRTNNII